MDVMEVAPLVVLAVAVVGAAVAWWLARQQRVHAAALIASLHDEVAAQGQQVAESTALRHRADLQQAIDTLLQVAGEQLDARVRSGAATLESRKELIDAELGRVADTLGQVTRLVTELDQQRSSQLGQITEQLHGVSRTHRDLARTTGALREALTSSQARGQWGERMAEDVLTAAGFRKGVNYLTQQTLPGGGRPDVTFLLPGDLQLHMDVKFPLTNYLAMLEAGGDGDRDAARAAFLRDVRARVKELARRGYVDPANGTLDCVLLFIPNEQVYGFVHEHDPALLDDALGQQVVLCAPSTLFAVLAVIRRSVDTVAVARTSDEIVALLAGFTDQWGRYIEEVGRLGRQLDTVRRTYDGVAAGPRRRQLERQLEAVEELRERRQIGARVVDERPRLLRLSGGDDQPGNILPGHPIPDDDTDGDVDGGDGGTGFAGGDGAAASVG